MTAVRHYIEQRSPEWYWRHLGTPSSSEVKKFTSIDGEFNFAKLTKAVMTALPGGPYKTNAEVPWEHRPLGQGALTHLLQKHDEQWRGVEALPDDGESSWAAHGPVAHGRQTEAEARSAFELTRGVKIEQIGCITQFGALASPDGLIGESDGYEVKCPTAAIHHRWLYFNRLPQRHKIQVHAQMAIGDLQRVWFHSYFLGLPELVVRVDRDEFTDKVEKCVKHFVALLDELKAAWGAPAEPPRPQTEADFHEQAARAAEEA